MKTWLIPISLAVLAGTARADQCEWIDDAVAAKAKGVLEHAPKYLAFCEPCGDKAPGVPQRASSIALAATDGGYQTLVVDGAPVDLAYVFVRTDDHHYRNLAALAGCPATGVSPSLSIEAETPSGVMIRAAADVLPPVPPPPPPVVAVAPPAPAPPPQVYVYTSTTHDVAWLPLLLATAGGFVCGAATTLVVIAMRGRRAMRPRAVDIPPG